MNYDDQRLAIEQALEDLEGVGGVPTEQEFFNEFVFRLGSRLGVEQPSVRDIEDRKALNNFLNNGARVSVEHESDCYINWYGDGYCDCGAHYKKEVLTDILNRLSKT